MTTQEQRILRELKAYPEGLHPTYFPTVMGILQYGRAINNLRSDFKCAHKNGNDACLANEHIINKRLPNGTTKFFYREDQPETNETFQEYIKKGRDERNVTNKIGLF